MTVTVPNWILWALCAASAVAMAVAGFMMLWMPRRRPSAIVARDTADEVRRTQGIADDTTDALAPIEDITNDATTDEGQAARDAVSMWAGRFDD